MATSALERYVLILLGGYYGDGKTTLAGTMPGPRLWLDAEGGAYDLGNVLTWDDFGGDASLLTPDTNVVINVEDYKTYRKAMDYVLGRHPFKTVILDSLPAIQEKMKRAIVGEMDINNYRKGSYEVWDKLLVVMAQDVEALNGRKLPNSKGQFNTVLIAAFDEEVQPHRVIMQGGIRKTLPRLPDVVGFLHVAYELDTDSGENARHRVLDIQTTEANIARVKCRLKAVAEKFGDQIWDPDLNRDIVRIINRRPKAATTKKETD